jgi:large subunit ribosomal protein L23
MEPFEIIYRPDVTEKSMKQVESENKLIFIVSRSSRKGEIQRAVEELYSVKVEEVNTVITPKGLKKAYIKLAPEYKAEEIATRLGIF